MAKIIPGKEEFHETIRYFENMIKKYNVELRLKTTFQSSFASEYDKVVLSTGIIPRKPKIKGINNSKVVSYIDVLNGNVDVGENVALIGAGGIGFDVAEFLSNKGKSTSTDASQFMKEWGIDITFEARGGVEGIKSNIKKNKRKIYLLQRKNGKVGAGLGKTTGWIHRFSLRNKDVKMINGVSYSHIDDLGLHFIKNDKIKFLKLDHIVICAGQLSNNYLYEETKKVNLNTELIGGAFESIDLDAKKAIDQAVRLAAIV